MELFILQTMHHPTEFTDQWIDDGTGENPPRSYADCLADVLAFRRGEAGPEMAASFSAATENVEWRIVPVAD